MAHRFVTEIGLNMMATSMVVLQDDHLDRMDDLDRDFHIYMIASRPRIAVSPDDFVFSEQLVTGAFVVQDGPRHIKVPLVAPQQSPPLDRIESTWPHTEFTLSAGTERRCWGKAALLAHAFPLMSDYLDLEVLYVGQAYGYSGERQAAERLSCHSTLQKILSATSRLQPDREVWLVMLSFEDGELLLTSFDGLLANTPGALEADEGRLERAFDRQLSEQQKINVIEAALIRYFEPKYNEMFRKSFPSVLHKTYSECYELDLNMVSVELQTEDLRLRLYSSVQGRSWRHLASFAMRSPEEREHMFALLTPPNTSPVDPGGERCGK